MLSSLSRGFIVAFLVLAMLLTPARAQSCSGDTYIVQPGDSLSSIAEKCGIPYAALVGINVEISNPDMIRPGQVIRLEAGVPLYKNPATGAAQEGGLQENGEYITRPGDSLARIAYLYRTNISDLLRENPQVRADRMIYPGQHIRLPRDARLVKGWIGVSTLFPRSGQTIEVRLVDFPAYAELDLNLGEMDLDNTVIVYETFEGKTDARGQARIAVKIPYYAWSGEEWVVEVVTTELPKPTRCVSPVMTID